MSLGAQRLLGNNQPVSATYTMTADYSINEAALTNINGASFTRFDTSNIEILNNGAGLITGTLALSGSPNNEAYVTVADGTYTVRVEPRPNYLEGGHIASSTYSTTTSINQPYDLRVGFGSPNSGLHIPLFSSLQVFTSTIVGSKNVITDPFEAAGIVVVNAAHAQSATSGFASKGLYVGLRFAGEIVGASADGAGIAGAIRPNPTWLCSIAARVIIIKTA